MKNLAVSTAITVVILLVLSSTVISVSISPSATLCEARCETATPYLVTLKTLWHRMSKRIGKENMSFESFVQSLIAASERYSRLMPLRNNLIAMIGSYQDCVKACEHQHSKRTGERLADTMIRPQI
ncbi:hypothetical protein KUTeg_014891, partial [Tegillarca granosa]